MIFYRPQFQATARPPACRLPGRLFALSAALAAFAALRAPAAAPAGTAPATAMDPADTLLRAAAPEATPVSADSGRSASDSAAPADSIGRKLYSYISYPFLQMITLPVEVLVVPAVKLALYPSKPPLRYLLNENVVDRTIELISFGPHDRIMLYPTMNLAPNTGSSTGLTLRDQALFGRTSESAVARGVLYVNGDWKFRAYLTASDIGGTGLNTKLALSMTRMKNASFNVPGTSAMWNFGDTTTYVSLDLSRLLFGDFAARGQYVFRNNYFGQSPTQNDSARADFLRPSPGAKIDEKMRGLASEWQDNIISLALLRDTRNNQNIALSGSDFKLSWQYHLTNAGHDYQAWDGTLTNYFKLGAERYEITSEEERKSGGLSMKKMLAKMEMEKLRKELFNRKVLVTHLYAAQSFEVPGNRMPMYGLQTLGNDTPMRGYTGSRFRNYTVFSAGAEYRFPILRLVDGVVFDEYGVSGRSWERIDYLENLKNSWGFGIRVRRPDIFLFRLQLGFHGLQGIVINMSVDEPY